MEYTVTYTNVTDWTVTVEAASPAEAMALAERKFDGGSLCNQCAHERNDGEWEPEFMTDANGVETKVDEILTA